MDNGQLSGIVFLDIRKAFDSIDHNILLHKLKDQFETGDKDQHKMSEDDDEKEPEDDVATGDKNQYEIPEDDDENKELLKVLEGDDDKELPEILQPRKDKNASGDNEAETPVSEDDDVTSQTMKEKVIKRKKTQALEDGLKTYFQPSSKKRSRKPKIF
ncbi:Hypothetical predicted protein [Paramuricea clavata]|uniref:Uncharacterized protein n=1 Tax=Paramuricea clavata TaxID=317549 RepID=A0A6S7ILM4_PARCT|nr:Hypothetical predicted protein [Paramuricea clavata]